MSNLIRNVANALNPLNTGPVQGSGGYMKINQYRTSLMGTPGAGKTVIERMIFYTARMLQQQLPDFHCTIDDNNVSTVKQDICYMEDGHFPPKTNAYLKQANRTLMNMWWGKNSLWGKKAATFESVDLAGEDYIAQSHYNLDKPDPAAYNRANQLVDFVYGSQILILAAPAFRAPIFKNGAAVEAENSNISKFADVNLSTIFDNIVQRRKKNNQPIKAVALCLTQCDKIDKYVEEKYGWNLYQNPDHVRAFLDKYFSWTTMSIKALKDTWSNTAIEYFPMFIETEKNADGSEKTWPDGWDQGHPVIAVEDRELKYAKQQTVNLINFIGRQV